MKIYISNGYKYLQGYVNILSNEVTKKGFFADVYCDLKKIRMPFRAIDEMRLDWGVFACWDIEQRLGFLLGIRSWLFRPYNFLIIEGIEKEQLALLEQELFLCGYKKKNFVLVNEYDFKQNLIMFNFVKSLSEVVQQWAKDKERYFMQKLKMQLESTNARRVELLANKDFEYKCDLEKKKFKQNDQKKTIIVRLMGGLGSQVGLYALGRKLAIKNKAKLKIDLSWFENNWPNTTNRAYRLFNFCIKENFATTRDLALTVGNEIKINEKAENDYYLNKAIIHLHNGYDYELADWQIPCNEVLIIGDGVSYDYYYEIKEILKMELQAKTELDKENALIMKKIKSACKSVALHIRLKDYLPSKNEEKEKWLDENMKFYKTAIDFIFTKEGEDVEFFVFSDDYLFFEKNKELFFEKRMFSKINLIKNDESKDWIDFLLMSNCNYHVNIGSAFSLMASWLAEVNDKKVVLPKTVFEARKNIFEKTFTNCLFLCV